MVNSYEDMMGENTDHSNHEELDAPENKMLRDRANRGVNAENIQSNRNSDLRTRSLRGTWNTLKATREAP